MGKTVQLLIALALLLGCRTASSTSPIVTVVPVATEPTPATMDPEPDLPEPEAVVADPAVSVAEEPSGPWMRDLCEPVDARWPYPTRAQRKATRKLMERTCEAMGVDEPSCMFFSKVVTPRESSYRSWVRHKMHGDVSAAANAYLVTASTYGWRVVWRMKDRRSGDLSSIELRAGGRREPNEHFTEVERWLSGGLGLGGLNIPYHLAKFDRLAPPEILCDTVVNTMVQISIARSAVDRYDAQNWYEVQAIYAGRTYYNRRGQLRPMSCSRGRCPVILSEERKERARRGDKAMRKRCNAVKMDCDALPVLGDVLRKTKRKRFTPQQRYELAEKVRGAPLPPVLPAKRTVTVVPGGT